MDIKALLFDFDYTLAESSAGVIECVNYALNKMHLPPAPGDIIKKTIGMPLNDTFFLLAKTDKIEHAEIFRKFFKQKADMVMADLTFIFKNVPDKFKEFKRKNIKIGIVSTKFRFRIHDILKRDNIDGYVDVIIGGDDVKSHKPDPEGLFLAIESLDANRDEITYVGDSIIDAAAAENASIDFIASLTGVTTKEDFKDYRVVKFIRDISEIE